MRTRDVCRWVFPVNSTERFAGKLPLDPLKTWFFSFLDPIFAFGLDVYAWNDENVLRTLVEADGTNVPVTVEGDPTARFFGFSSDTTFTEVRFVGVVGDGWAFDNLAYASPPSVIPIPAAIDIKPGSDPNCFNANGHGVIPVAILGSDSFDVTEIAQDSLSFGGLEVQVRGNKGPLCQVDYSDGDEYLDLVCQFEDNSDSWSPGEGEATLTGSFNGGGDFEGTDSICIVP